MKIKEARIQQRLAWSSLGLLVILGVIINLFGDQLWWTVPIIYGPRWIWSLLLLGILPLWYRNPFKAAVFTLAGGSLFLLGIMDFRLGPGRIRRMEGTRIRVMEFNIEADQGSPDKLPGLLEYLQESEPDLIAIAECTPRTQSAILKGAVEYTLDVRGTLCLLVKGEIELSEARDPSEFWPRYGSGQIVRSDVLVRGSRLRIGVVHLATPRIALARYQDSSSFQTMRSVTIDNQDLREKESAAARRWIATGGPQPLLVLGDFNLPVASTIYRQYWGDLNNAFSITGWGLGHTKVEKLWGVRIDHILSNSGIIPVRSWLGPDLGSDHLPLMAELIVPTVRQ